MKYRVHWISEDKSSSMPGGEFDTRAEAEASIPAYKAELLAIASADDEASIEAGSIAIDEVEDEEEDGDEGDEEDQDTALEDAIEAVRAWTPDRSVRELRSLLDAVDAAIDDEQDSLGDLVDLADLPSADFPGWVDTSYPCWALDDAGLMLVGGDLDQFETLAEHAEATGKGPVFEYWETDPSLKNQDSPTMMDLDARNEAEAMSEVRAGYADCDYDGTIHFVMEEHAYPDADDFKETRFSVYVASKDEDQVIDDGEVVGKATGGWQVLKVGTSFYRVQDNAEAEHVAGRAWTEEPFHEFEVLRTSAFLDVLDEIDHDLVNQVDWNAVAATGDLPEVDDLRGFFDGSDLYQVWGEGESIDEAVAYALSEAKDKDTVLKGDVSEAFMAWAREVADEDADDLTTEQRAALEADGYEFQDETEDA